MENLTKFSTTSETSAAAAAAACKCDSSSMNMSFAGGGSSGGGVGVGLASSGGGAVGGNNKVTTPPVSAHTSTWLAALHVNNNNNTTMDKSFNAKDSSHHQHHNHHHQHHHHHMCGNNLTTTTSNLVGCDMYQKNCGKTTFSTSTATNTMARVALIEEDEGGGIVGSGSSIDGNKQLSSSQNGTASDYVSASAMQALGCKDDTDVVINAAASSLLQTETDYDSYDMCGAVSLSPPLLDDSEAAAAAALGGVGDLGLGDGGHSNRTSLNNSTENLSYISDNFFGDDLILLGEDGDLEAEELSLNSDDCIYTYRGAGAEFDLTQPPMVCLAGNFGGVHGPGNIAQEEETDFLEMDFDPDPPSELEYNQAADLRNCVNDSKDPYLMQRDSCHLVTPPKQRHQLFSSPIDDLPPAPKALQAQSLLSKNFARITLHLDQIQKDYSGEDDDEKGTRERLNSALDTRPLEEEFVKERAMDTCHSLPNTLHDHFTNRCNSESAVITASKDDNALTAPLQVLGTNKSPSKITGAKPKRLSTFSSTSSTSSKNSSKSRNSLRSAFQTINTLGISSSFDERSVSCSEFRTERDSSSTTAVNCKQNSLLASNAPHTAPTTASSLMPEFNAFNDETCLDCLEKEFLANTIGKALDPLGCSKCRKRLGRSSLYGHHHHHHQQQQQRSTRDINACTSTSKYRRSASPTTTFFFSDQASSPTSRLFSCEFLNSQARKRQEWDSFMQEQKELPTSEMLATRMHHGIDAAGKLNVARTKSAAAMVDVRDLNDSLKNLETKLFKNLKPPDPCTAILSTNNLKESSLVQALDKLQIAYNQELLKMYFKKSLNNNNANINNNNFSSSSTNICITTSHQEFKNLKQFLLYVSKRPANYHKLQRLIRKITQQQVIVQFKKDTSITEMEMVPVRVSEILHYWSQCKNLECLKDMDKRFQDANVLGKIANIIRQAHQRSSSSSRRPDYIYIPQYYPSGFLTLSVKC
ncbi:uncharacterized protein LOC106083201 [Stomoxys calcitrans]|uniref:uncharacterized protein LOC106083201 n=1 Tax=Stomoxys calcitrans TaxID=35570 RepID=UPI0027E386C0|nr:uncharacterized protein LOC106083201 [Stomoxys calcitrans]